CRRGVESGAVRCKRWVARSCSLIARGSGLRGPRQGRLIGGREPERPVQLVHEAVACVARALVVLAVVDLGGAGMDRGVRGTAVLARPRGALRRTGGAETVSVGVVAVQADAARLVADLPSAARRRSGRADAARVAGLGSVAERAVVAIGRVEALRTAGA